MFKMREDNSGVEQGKKYGKKFLILYFSIIAFVIAADQISKLFVLKYLKEVGDVPLIKGVFHLTYVENKGAAFGMLKDARWLFMIISAVAVVLISVYLILNYKKTKPFFAICLAAIAGGGVGNMIDRIGTGFVVDFLNFELIHFPVFNIADSFVTVGAFALIIYLIVSEIKNGRKKA